jgi:hypothetical protein
LNKVRVGATAAIQPRGKARDCSAALVASPMLLFQMYQFHFLVGELVFELVDLIQSAILFVVRMRRLAMVFDSARN